MRILSALALLALSTLALGDSPAPPTTYEVESPNKQFVFVMIPPITLEEELKLLSQEGGEKLRQVRGLRSVSGMYRNDGSSEPLWTVSWYAAAVEIFSDGVHLVRHGAWASETANEAISFFEKDKLIRSYRISELVRDKTKLKRTVSHFFWSEDQRLEDSTLRYTLLTVDNGLYVFDVTTGKILSMKARHKMPAARSQVAAVPLPPPAPPKLPESAIGLGDPADQAAVKTQVERLLVAVGDHDYETLRGMFLPGGNVGFASLRNGAWVTGSKSVDDWIADEKQNGNPQKYSERASKFRIQIFDGHLANVVAEATLNRDGVPKSRNMDNFILIKQADGWKFLTASYTATPIGSQPTQ